MNNSVKKWLVSLGPGIVTAAIVFGPSKITITSKMGAMYGYSLLWVAVAAVFFMIVFTSISSRIGLASEVSLLSTVRNHYGKWFAAAIGIGIFLVAASFQAGNSIGVGISVGEATGTAPGPWIILFNLIGIGLLFFRNFYRTLERLVITIVTLMLFSFLTTMFLSGPDASQIVKGFVPSIPPGSGGLLIAFFASCFSVVGAFYQSYLIQARKKINPAMVPDSSKSLAGMVILGVMSVVLMICGAAVLHEQGIPVNKASDMARALQPLFGHNAALLFLIGLFGSSFSSLVGNATIGGSLLSDGFGYGSQLDSKIVKAFIALVMVIGAVVAIGYEKPPLELIIFAQSVTIFLVPFIGTAMYLLSNKRSLMGSHVNTPFMKYAGLAGLLLLFVLAIYNFNELFLK